MPCVTSSSPPVADQPGENATVTVPLSFAPVSGRRIRVTVVDVREAQAFSYYANHPLLLPAAIAELGIPGLALPAAARTGTEVSSECRSDLLRIDGRAVPLRVVGDRADAARLVPLAVQPCDPSDPTRVPTLQLDAGSHVVRATPGARTAIGLDRLVLASAAGGAALETASELSGGEPPPAPRVEVTKNGRTSLRVHVDGATAPFWLVLGQSQSKGWKATVVDGEALGGSRLVDGYANGWFVRPARPSFDVVLDWTPQRGVAISLLVSVVVALGCVAIVIVTWWRRRGMLALVTAPDAEDADVTLAWPGEGGAAPRGRARDCRSHRRRCARRARRRAVDRRARGVAHRGGGASTPAARRARRWVPPS